MGENWRLATVLDNSRKKLFQPEFPWYQIIGHITWYDMIWYTISHHIISTHIISLSYQGLKIWRPYHITSYHTDPISYQYHIIRKIFWDHIISWKFWRFSYWYHIRICDITWYQPISYHIISYQKRKSLWPYHIISYQAYPISYQYHIKGKNFGDLIISHHIMPTPYHISIISEAEKSVSWKLWWEFIFWESLTWY